ncbi:glycosyl transferase family 9 [Ferrimonas balearica DSM 9799]|uniref:Glycosyl transferase family 9 n=1 Tax=Ferrimonas balearica (strain DSM 9799 / CCM 4581 / KCTC 23876 / PAT) TaxID=550540 RepID=E1SW62_FERBD|nr:glycosyltransferase family 9 protein [Ferrimonas balearica]ADN74362.1 glycosyl transferase family 9 [Ferrimonas balearica DSM 9799]
MPQLPTLPESPRSIVVLRLSAIGDVCHAVAAVQAIQRRHPDAELTWVVGKVEASLLAGLPGVELVPFDKSKGVQGYRELWQRLRGRQFDVLLHMQVALRASVASLGIRAKVKLGFDKSRAKEGQWLFTNQRIAAQHEPHVLEGFMGFARHLGVTDTQPRWQIPVGEDDQAFALTQIPDDRPTAIICASASKAERNWLPERYAEVADQLVTQGYQVLLCGGPAQHEHELARAIEAQARQPLLNLVGQTSLKSLLALLRRAKVVLAPDTGPAHMAVTQGTPVVALMAHSNPSRTGPYGQGDTTVSCYQQHVENQQGKPLSQLRWGTRAKGPELMASIDTASVMAAINRALSR